jgi:hypothetical protein
MSGACDALTFPVGGVLPTRTGGCSLIAAWRARAPLRDLFILGPM